MENREQKFNLEFGFLENPKILELQKLVDAVVSVFTKSEDRESPMDELKTKWEKIQKEYIREIGTNDNDIKDFLRFVNSNIKIMDVGGMNLGRSAISNFINEKAKELEPYFEKFGKDL